MGYIFELLKVVPVIAIITVIVYGAIFMVLKAKRKTPTILKVICEFLLLGWCVMFLYVTQIMSFGNGIGEGVNLTPLHSFYIAAKYGLINAGMLEQIILNVAMTVPLGFLLPYVFPKRFKTFLRILGVSFAVTLATEVLQLLTGRSADIDDIIANTLGGLFGFALYIICSGLHYWLTGKKQGKALNIERYAIKATISVLLIAIILSPFVAIKIINDNNAVGYVYYGHLRPANIKIANTVSNEESTAKIYKYVSSGNVEKIKENLKSISGFTADFVKEDDDLVCKNNDTERLFIYKDLTWSINYNYGRNDEVNITKLPTEEQAVSLAYSILNKYGISSETVEYNGLSNEYGDDNLHLIFISTKQEGDTLIWGNISIAIGENGKLNSISDSRKHFEFYQNVETISPQESVAVAQDVGLAKIGAGSGSGEGVAYVTSIIPSYYFNSETGYLIPTWQIEGTFRPSNGNGYQWMPNIDSRK